MKFAHLADCHLGGWREPELRKLGVESFDKAIDICIQENVAFVLIAGDLFNNALPPIELLKEVVHSLNKLKEALKDKKYKNTDWKTRGITDIPGFYDAKSSVINAMLNRSVGEDLLAREVLNWNASSNSPAGVSPFKGKVPCPRLGDHFVITMLQPGGAIHTIECTATSDFDCVAGTGSMICTDDSRQPGSATLTLTVSSTGDLSGSVQPFGGGASFSLSSGFVVIRVV